MNRQQVKSSQIAEVGFEDGVLEVQFVNGAVYRYTGTDLEDHYNAMLSAPSVGKYFNQHIRGVKHIKAQKVAG